MDDSIQVLVPACYFLGRSLGGALLLTRVADRLAQDARRGVETMGRIGALWKLT
jgi:hypothetical protein